MGLGRRIASVSAQNVGVENVATDGVVVCSADAMVLDAVQAAAAVMGREVAAIPGADGLPARWRAPGVVFVGLDQASAAAALGLPRRPEVYVVGADPVRLAAVSVVLGAEVVPLPDGVPWLASLLADGGPAPRGRLVTVLGGSGGVGASTLAAGLALAAGAKGGGSALVDLDSAGGGIDLLLGAERVPGWRWPRLASASGRLGDLGGELPSVAGVALVSMARAAVPELGREPVAAVCGALQRDHDLVVVDVGRAGFGAGREALRLGRHAVVVVAATLRGVAAARQTLRLFEIADPVVVVRRLPGGGIALGQIEDALGADARAVLPDEPRLARLAEDGDPPSRLRRRPWARAVAGLLDDVLAA